jgi:cell division protein FtsN
VASSGLPTDLWAIQIAAFRMKNDAVAWMVKTKYDHAKVFDGLASEIVEAKRDMATYYRVRFGTFPDRSAALAKCDEAKSVGLNCIVVTPR